MAEILDEVPEWMLCLDPGLTSGLAILHYNVSDGITLASSLEGSMPFVGEFTRQFLQRHPPEKSEVVIERFTITVQTAKNSQAPWSLETIGTVKWLILDEWDRDPEDVIVLQYPAEAKRLVSNQMLRDAGLWHRSGAGHANDAIRHGLRRFAILGVYDAFAAERG